jgi:predicted AAA+ superfamily ATPase
MVNFKDMKIPRTALLARTQKIVKDYPVTLLIGPRQCGKTTLAQEIVKNLGGSYFDLEDPENPLIRETAKLTLKDLRGLVVIDEIQRQPELFSLLRVLADRRPLSARFLILGSASPDLIKGASETLAGRIAYLEMGGFDFQEIQTAQGDGLWIRGGFPRSFLAKNDESSFEWRVNFIRTFLERDIPQWGFRIPAPTLRRFWTMLAHFHGQVWNAADLARSLGSKEDTARKYLDILTGAFLVRQLHPWHENVGKRLVKAPKIYLRDTGILHTLLGLKNKRQLQSHPKLGFSWEGYVIEQIVRLCRAEREVYFYKTYAGAELDCLLIRGGKRYGFEIKYADAPTHSKSLRVVFEDLKLDRLWVVYPGEQSYPLDNRIDVVPFGGIIGVLKKHKLMK